MYGERHLLSIRCKQRVRHFGPAHINLHPYQLYMPIDRNCSKTRMPVDHLYCSNAPSSHICYSIYSFVAEWKIDGCEIGDVKSNRWNNKDLMHQRISLVSEWFDQSNVSSPVVIIIIITYSLPATNINPNYYHNSTCKGERVFMRLWPCVEFSNLIPMHHIYAELFMRSVLYWMSQCMRIYIKLKQSVPRDHDWNWNLHEKLKSKIA